jgi:hypothetical protein
VDERGNLARAPGKDWCGGSESTHAEHCARLEFAKERFYLLQAATKPEPETKQCTGRFSIKSDAWHFLDAKLRAPRGRERIDIFFRDQHHDRVTAFEEHLADGQAGKQMSAGSTCCDDEIHRTNPPAVIRCSSRHGRKGRKVPCPKCSVATFAIFA